MLKLSVWLGGLWMLAGCSEVQAQFPPNSNSGPFLEMTATEDGKWVYFTSQLTLQGQKQGFQAETRLYRYGPDGVTLFAERGKLAAKDSFSSDDGITGPRVSADGSVVGFTFRDVCFYRKCVDSFDEAAIRGSQVVDLGRGSLQMSRNGRWAWIVDARQTVTATLVDLHTDATTKTPPPYCTLYFCSYPDRALASDGSLLIEQQEGAFGIWKKGVFQLLSIPPGYSVTAISDDGTAVFLQGKDAAEMDIASGKLTTVAHGVISMMDASSDGRYVLYGLYGQGSAFLTDVVSGTNVTVPLMPGESATAGALAASDIAFVATNAGRIVKFTVSTRTVDALFPAVQRCGPVNTLVPGSLVRVQCTGIGPLPDWTGVDWTGRIQLFDVAMPILFASATEVGFQVPWNIPAANIFDTLLTLDLPGNPLFTSNSWVDVEAFAPEFEKADPGQTSLLGLKLIKADWSGLLTEQPGPGDIVNAYMTGLGAVNGPMVDGVPSPDGVVAPIVQTLQCRFYPQSGYAETVFAGLAPGFVGVYQATFRMPADAGLAPITNVGCYVPFNGLGGGVGGGPSGPLISFGPESSHRR